ncbi:hypothetical protein ACTU6V_09090 [Microbacterium sp. A204]|uniref:hypothetical protein n=1 Tax=Microbacterium sp. A204 TaxID=3457321 RepID=UPI003FD5FD61
MRTSTGCRVAVEREPIQLHDETVADERVDPTTVEPDLLAWAYADGVHERDEVRLEPGRPLSLRPIGPDRSRTRSIRPLLTAIATARLRNPAA